MNDEQQRAESAAGEHPKLSAHWQERWNLYRRVASGHLFTLKGERRKIGAYDLLQLRCPRDHLLQMRGRDLLRGIGCVECRNQDLENFRKRQLEDAVELAAARGGQCRSSTYTSAKLILEWECAKGHGWTASLDNVRSKGSWCPRCARCKPRPARRRNAEQSK